MLFTCWLLLYSTYCIVGPKHGMIFGWMTVFGHCAILMLTMQA